MKTLLTVSYTIRDKGIKEHRAAILIPYKTKLLGWDVVQNIVHKELDENYSLIGWNATFIEGELIVLTKNKDK